MELKLTDFSKKAGGRSRGQEACNELQRIIAEQKPSEIIIALTGFNLISSSFIDELVIQSNNFSKEYNVKIFFRVQEQEILEKLQKASGIREIPVKYFWKESEQLQDVEPIYPEPMQEPIMGLPPEPSY